MQEADTWIENVSKTARIGLSLVPTPIIDEYFCGFVVGDLGSRGHIVSVGFHACSGLVSWAAPAPLFLVGCGRGKAIKHGCDVRIACKYTHEKGWRQVLGWSVDAVGSTT